MGRIRKPIPVKLVASIFAAEEALLAAGRAAMASCFGAMDYQSALLPFDHTSYYASEFGPSLVRQIVAFADLVAPERLAEIKTKTNELEDTWTVAGRRRANLDPGYVSLSKLVLATTKDYSHRVYLGQGIYAEVTLHYRKGAFRPWEWTYPDYASGRFCEIFQQIRTIYLAQLRLLQAWVGDDSAQGDGEPR